METLTITLGTDKVTFETVGGDYIQMKQQHILI